MISAKPYTVAIIEDQRMFRDLMTTLINNSENFQVIDTATDARQGWEICRAREPAIALIDIELPDTSGIDLGIRLKQLASPPALVAVSSIVDPITTTKVFDSGFNGYVEKDQSPDIVLEALETAAEGGLYFTQLVRENRRKVFSDPDALNKILSPREQSVVAQVGRGMQNRDIAGDLGLSVRTVENHRYRIMKKLSLRDTAELVDFARRLGLDRLG